MNTLIIYVLLATISPMFAGIFPVLLQRKDGNFQGMTLALLGISAGMLFAVSTLDLIPEAVQFAASSVTEHFETEDEEILDHLEHEKEESIRIACAGIFAGFIFLFFIQQVIAMTGGGHSHSHSHSHNQIDTKRHSDPSLDIHNDDHILLSGSGNNLLNNSLNGSLNGGSNGSSNNILLNNSSDHFLHSQNFAALVGLAHGVMISGAFSASSSIGGKVGIAIVLHKFPDGFVLSSLLNQNPKFKHQRKHQSSKISWFMFVCSMTIVGALISALILGEMPKRMLGFILGMGAGSFLFITCVVILPELLEGKSKMSSVISFTIGYLSFLATEIFFDAH